MPETDLPLIALAESGNSSIDYSNLDASLGNLTPVPNGGNQASERVQLAQYSLFGDLFGSAIKAGGQVGVAALQSQALQRSVQQSGGNFQLTAPPAAVVQSGPSTGLIVGGVAVAAVVGFLFWSSRDRKR